MSLPHDLGLAVQGVGIRGTIAIANDVRVASITAAREDELCRVTSASVSRGYLCGLS